MEWSGLIGIITALVAAIAIPLAVKKRKKEAPAKVAEFTAHLHSVGLAAVAVDKEAEQEYPDVFKGTTGEKIEQVFGLDRSRFRYLRIVSSTSQYGTYYYLEFLVMIPYTTAQTIKKTRLRLKKTSAFGGAVSDVYWQGDPALAQSMNYDFSLKDRLMGCPQEELKGGITIQQKKKSSYVKIRTGYSPVSADFLEAVSLVAGHIASRW